MVFSLWNYLSFLCRLGYQFLLACLGGVFLVAIIQGGKQAGNILTFAYVGDFSDWFVWAAVLFITMGIVKTLTSVIEYLDILSKSISKAQSVLGVQAFEGEFNYIKAIAIREYADSFAATGFMCIIATYLMLHALAQLVTGEFLSSLIVFGAAVLFLSCYSVFFQPMLPERVLAVLETPESEKVNRVEEFNQEAYINYLKKLSENPSQGKKRRVRRGAANTTRTTAPERF